MAETVLSGPSVVETDVLIVGGGVAGCLAALAARDAGAEVLVCDKGGRLAWSGSVGGGVDQFLAVLETDEEWDQPAYLMQSVGQLTDGLVDLAVVERMVYELPRVFRRIEALGVNFREKDAEGYARHRAFGLPGAYHVDFDGKKFKQTIARAVRRAGAKELTRCAIVSLFAEGGAVAGALGLNIRTGELYAIRAKSVVLATGDVNRISRNVADMPYASWHCPYNTGDAQKMALDVGAVLANMEFIEATLGPTGFSSQGTNALTGLGAHYLNGSGERFMFKYDPLGERARRSVLVDAVISETLEGNGPIFLDVRHLPTEELVNIERTLEVDRHTVPGFLRQKGVSLAEEPVEISISEFSIRRSGVYFRGSGIVIDEAAAAAVAGLYAAGDCCTVSAGIAGASSLGWIAGASAAGFSATQKAAPELPADELAADIATLNAHLDENRTGSYWDLEDAVREVVTRDVGFRRSAESMARAHDVVAGLAAEEAMLKAADAHELGRVVEAKAIREMAEVMVVAAEAREETRSGSSHYRVDYPEPDERWLKVLGVRKRDGRYERVTGEAEGPWKGLVDAEAVDAVAAGEVYGGK